MTMLGLFFWLNVLTHTALRHVASFTNFNKLRSGSATSRFGLAAKVSWQSNKSFKPGEIWHDTDGKVIDAHGAGFLEFQGKYYWYGEIRSGMPATHESCFSPTRSARAVVAGRTSGVNLYQNDATLSAKRVLVGRTSGVNLYQNDATLSERRVLAGRTPGVNLYQSDGDLYTWKHVGRVFDARKTGTQCLERPKVIQCPGTGQFVMWAKGFPRGGSVKAVVSIASSPEGPFELVNASQPFYAPDGLNFADAALHVDTQGRAFVFFRARQAGFRMAQLSSDCTRIDGHTVQLASPAHEAPAFFSFKNRSYLWTSGTSGWDASAAKLLVRDSESPLGSYREMGNPTGSGTTFDSQSTFILPNPAYEDGSKRAPFIYIADRWEPQTHDFGRYVWLPLFVSDEGHVTLANVPEWRYDEDLDLSRERPMAHAINLQSKQWMHP